MRITLNIPDQQTAKIVGKPNPTNKEVKGVCTALIKQHIFNKEYNRIAQIEQAKVEAAQDIMAQAKQTISQEANDISIT